MSDLGIEDLKQIINFYKQKCSDLEFAVLELQIKINNIISGKEVPVPATKISKDNKDD
jgi:hypothetical protein